MQLNKENTRKNSQSLWQRALKLFPGGVNSPVRAFRSVGGTPVFMEKGRGKYVFDADGNRYLDFLSSWGPLILGHAPRSVVKATARALKDGSTFGTITEREVKLAEFILERLAFVDKIRFVNSGTEAVMTALRLARGFTKRQMVVKFEGCYHGHTDALLARAGSGLLTLTGNIAEASSPGVPDEIVQSTLVLPLDNENAFNEALAVHGNKIACVIIEPLPANAGLLPQRREFVEHILTASRARGILVIFDEVISGFRLEFGGYAGREKLYPDLVTYGKIIGGGLPVGAVAGKLEIMNYLAPEGPVYQAGTLSGNPLAMAAGYAQLKRLTKGNGKAYCDLAGLAIELKLLFADKIKPLFAKKNWQISLEQEASLFWFVFQTPGQNQTVRTADRIATFSAKIYGKIFHALLARNIYLAPSAYEVGFLNQAMRKRDIQYFIEQLRSVLTDLPDKHEDFS